MTFDTPGVMSVDIATGAILHPEDPGNVFVSVGVSWGLVINFLMF